MRLLRACAAVFLLTAAGCATAREPRSLRVAAVEAVRAAAQPLAGSDRDYDALLELIGEHRYVLLGDATHGTQEFYAERARLTRRLIEEKGFTVLLIEADWPDAYDVNDFVHGRGASSPEAALGTFDRFPAWMWGNEPFRDLVTWIRGYNQDRGRERPAGVYGMDLYSVPESMDDVIAFLRETDKPAASRAESRYACFQRYRKDRMQQYGEDVEVRGGRSCAAPAAAQFDELTRRVQQEAERHKPGDDRLVSAWQNARVVANGEAYYRTMYRGNVASWNLRDRHMADTSDALSKHLNEGESPAKVIVWAHNSHLGDARLTARADVGEINVGQLMRQRHGDDAVLIGFTTYEGSVRAASEWGGPDRDQPLTRALADSVSGLLHETGLPAFTLVLRGEAALQEALARERLQRFVGVIYARATERASHYFETEFARQYDAVVHIDRTSALKPVRR